MTAPALEVRGLRGGYGAGRMIVDGVDLHVAPGEIVAVIGQNGAGKSTLLRAITNMLPVREGTVRLGGRAVDGVRPHLLLDHGLAYVPQGRSTFPRLTVAENLRMGGFRLRDAALLARRVAQAEAMFPVLAARRGEFAASLSGGEQRMLEIGRTLVMDPSVVLLDEPSIGLAPRLVDAVFDAARRLTALGKAVLVVEQNVRKALLAADRGLVLELGRVRLEDRASALVDDPRVRALYMGVRG